MTATPTQAFARAVAALVRDDLDIVTVLADLMSDSRDMLGASAVGLLLTGDLVEPEVLSSTTHSLRELELYQLQSGHGPCVDAARSIALVRVTGASEIEARWGDVGRAITAAGFTAVAAYPLRWRTTCLGALNVFWSDASGVGADVDALGQSLADIATIVVLHPEHLSADDITRRTRAALDGRTVIEQAKGVLAYLGDVPVDVAYARLRDRARVEGRSLTDMSNVVVREAATRGR
jgi:hypothetical protein